MAIKFTPIYTNEAEYIQGLARSSDLFRNDAYNYAVTQGQGEDYAYALAGTKTRESDSFVLQDYNLLSGQDQYMYLLNEYYIDKTETAIDEETGKAYNVYERNKEYLDYKIQEAVDLQTYESLNDFERFFATIGGFIGNALNELFLGTIEGLVDLGAIIVGQKDWAATDFTGVQANREALQRYARAYTYIDKNWFAGMINDVTTGITKMAPLLINPYAAIGKIGVGSLIYFGAMAGNTAEAAIRANPDIDYWSLLLYTAGTTALEFATEKISGKLFGTGKLVGGAKSGNFFTRFALDFASEGFEEAVAEIGGSLLYNMMVDPTAPIASFSDIMYAGLIGGLIGGVATTGRVAGTRGKTVLADGTIVDTKVAKQEGLEGKKLSKTKSLFLQESIADLRQQLSKSNEMKLQAKYAKEPLEQIKTNHAEEYNEAVAKDQKLRNKMIKSSIGLSNILASAGVEGFTKATQLLDYQAATQERLLKNFVSKSTGVSAENRAVEEKFRTLANGASSFTVSDTLNATQQKIKDGIKKLYNKNVYFGNIGEQDGVMKRHGLTLDENTIILDINLTQNESIETIMEKVIKEELVHTLQFQSGILNAKTLKDLMDQYKQLGGETIRTEENVAYSQASELTKISEAQAKALAETLLFDKFTIARIFSTNRGLFNRIYNWLRAGKNKIEELKQRKTNKDKVKYKQLLKCMKTYRDSVAETIGNEQDATIAKSEMNLSDEELQELIDTYRPDYTNEHYTLLKSEYSLNTTRRRNAERLLSEARADINKSLPFSYRNVFKPEYYGTIKAQDGTDINFVEAIMQRNPDKDFKYNLQEFMIQETGFAINERTGSLMEVLDYNKVTTQDFDTTCAKLQQDPNALRKYNNLAQIFDKKFVDKFIDSTGFNELENVELRFVASSEKSNKQAEYVGLNPLTQKPMITVYMSENQTMSLAEINNFKHKLFHETTHALADIQGLPNGTSVDYVRSALKEMNSPQTVHRLAKLLLTNNFYNENKNNLDELIENVAYGIYAITDGEYAAEAYAESISRKGDMKIRLKAGYLMNRSGFTTDGLYLYGYGRFAGITLQANSIVQAKASYKRSALRKATEVVAYSKESGLRTFLESNGVIDLEKAGFSYELIDSLENETLTNKDLLDMFNRDEIGTPEATNIIITWLTRDKPNKNVKTIEDINKIKKDGLINAMTYNKIRQKNDPQYDKNETHSYEEVKSFIDKNPNAKITVKTKEGTREVSAIKYKYKQFDVIESYLTVENSNANQIILASDFDYSVNKTEQLVKDLRNNKIRQERQEFTALDAKTADTEGKDYSALDKIAAESYVDIIDSGTLDGTESSEKESSESKLTRIANEAKKNLSEWLTTSGRSGKAYEIKETLLDYSKNIRESETDMSFNDIVSKEDFENIISSVITDENWKTLWKKLDNNTQFIDALFGKGTSLDLRKQIKNEFSKVQETTTEKLRDIAQGVSKKSNIKPKEIVSETILETTQPAVEIPETTEEIKPSEKETSEKTSKEIVLVLDSLPAEILTLLKDSNTDESRAQLFEGADTEYTKVSSKIVHDNMELFMQINDANYEQTRIGLSSSPQALTLFDYYTVEYLGTFSKETQQKILNNTRRAQTAAAQRQALQSKRVKDRKPVSDLKRTLTQQGYEVVLTEADVVEILGDDTIIDKDAEINRLQDEITKLKDFILNDIKEGRKMAQQEDETQLKNLAAKKAALESGDLFEILDTLISEMGLEQATKTMEKVLRKVVKTMKISDKEVGIYTYDKKGNLKSFPKLRKATGKLFLGLKKFRMWAMLSSPVSWIRNWIGNKGMQALDGVTNTVERFLTKNTSLGKNISGDSLKYNETKGGKDLNNYIDEKYGEYLLNSVIRKEDSRWDVTGQKTQALEYAKREEKARTGNIFVKAINKAVNWEQWGLERGFLGDEPTLIRSICKNTANLIASNVEWCLKGIQNEYDALQEIIKSGRALSTQEQETRMKAMEKALETKNLKDILDALSDDAISYLIENAGQRSFEQYFKNSNMFSEWIYKLGQKSPILGEMMSWVMPFPKVAANILTMAYRYSPLGFIRALSQMSTFKQQSKTDYKGRIDEFAGAKTIRSFSEATVGTFMWIVGMIAGALGWIEMDDDDYMGPSVKIGDFKMSLSDLAPSLTVLSVGAAMMQGWKNKEVGLKRALNVLYDNTLLGNFDNLFNYSSSESFLQNLGITYMGQYIPAFVKLLAKTSDRRKMDKSGNNYWEKLWNTFKSYIPGLSYTVPSKVNPYTGEDVYRSGTNAWWFNILNAISPLEMTYTSKSEEQKLAESLGAKTSGLTGRFTINNKDYNVTGAEKEELAKYRADYIQTQYSKISSGREKVTIENEKGVRITTTWDKLTDTQKKTVMERIYSDASSKAKIKYWLDSGNIYRTSNQNEFNELKKLFKSGIEYRSNWSKSKFIER